MLGLASIKAEGVELAFTPQEPQTPPTAISGINPANVFATKTEGVVTNAQYAPLLDMTSSSDDPQKRVYFVRQREDLGVVERLTISPDWTTDSGRWSPAVEAIRRQVHLIQSLDPLVRCESLIGAKVMVLDARQLEQENQSVITALLALDRAFGDLADFLVRTNELVNEQWWKDIDEDRQRLSNEVIRELNALNLLLPPNFRRDPNAQGFGDCKPDFTLPSDLLPADKSTPFSKSYLWTPPYTAIFAAYAYAAEGSYDTGLRVLDRWLAIHPRAPSADPERQYLPWLRDEAELDFVVIQGNGNPSFIIDSAGRRAFETTFHDLTADWHISLGAGQKCSTVDSLPRSASPGSDQLAKSKSDLVATYASVTGSWLHAAVDTRSPDAGEGVTALHQGWARKLIALGRKCLEGESDGERRQRQALALFEGGRTLARWAIDGSRQGLLVGTESDDARREARKALWEALPELRQLESDDIGDQPSERLPIALSAWELYRRAAEQEILDLDGYLTR
jgi:hypothetical protein